MGMKKKIDMTEHQNIPDTEKKHGVAMALHDLFLDKGELCAAEARRLLKVLGRKMSYASVQKLFYDLRQIDLIEFVRSTPGKALIDKRYYRIITGKENDPRWNTYPHYELYPASKLGGLKYEIGTSKGRAKKYVKGD